MTHLHWHRTDARMGENRPSRGSCKAWSFALVRRPKHNEFLHVQPCTEARIPRRGYPYLNRLPIFMTQARAPTPHEVAAKSPVNVHLPGAVREKLLSTASAPAQVTHRGEGQIRYEAFRTIHAAGISLRGDIRLPQQPPIQSAK